MLKVSKSVFVSIKFPSFLIVKRLQAVTPCVLRYSVIFSSVSCFSILSRIIPLQLLSVLCSVTMTLILIFFCNFQEIISLRFSVCFEQKSSIFYFFFFTFSGVPIIDSICFSIMNGDSEVIGLSSLLEITKNFAKFSFALNVKVVGCVSSSEESNARNRFREAMVMKFFIR